MTDHDVVVATPPTNDNADDETRLDQSVAEELVERARAEGVDLVGPGGLLGDLTKQILERHPQGGRCRHGRVDVGRVRSVRRCPQAR